MTRIHGRALRAYSLKFLLSLTALKKLVHNAKKDLGYFQGLSSVREKIRTPGLLVRSQTLYPAELHAHLCDLCRSQRYLVYSGINHLSIEIVKKIK